MSLKLKGNPSISVNIFSKLYLLIYDEIKRSTDKWTKIVIFVISLEQHLQGRLENNNVLSMRKSTAPIDAVVRNCVSQGWMLLVVNCRKYKT
jgi:hypothetical protein